MLRSLVIALLLTSAVFAQDAASIAMLVTNEPFDANPVLAALQSNDALTRATAARVLTMRGGDVAALRNALAKEQDADAAREEIRAVVLLGTVDDVAFAREHLSRFPAALDAEFIEAVGRRGAPEAIDLYLKYAPSLRDVTAPTKLALWGRTNSISIVASKLLGAKDARGFVRVLDNAIGAGIAVPASIVASALANEDATLREPAVWYLVDAYAADPKVMPAMLRDAASAEREGAQASEAFARELVRRMFGAKRTQNGEWTKWLSGVHDWREYSDAVLALFTLEERQALKPLERKLASVQPSLRSDAIAAEVRKAAFSVPVKLPRGLGKAMLAKAKCYGTWVGVVTATVDRAGRVQSVDTSRVYGEKRCVSALASMLRLSFAVPASIHAPLSTPDLQVVKGKRNACFNDDPLTTAKQLDVLEVGEDVEPPVIVSRVEPEFPAEVRRSMMRRDVRVVAESTITREGCVRDVRILGQSSEPQLNATAVLALSDWMFKPGTFHGRAVDVIFNLTVNFKLN